MKSDPKSPVYIHFAWVKPGKNTYTINYNPADIESDGSEGRADAAFNLFMNTKMTKGKKCDQTFFVHEMLSTYREEPVFKCKYLNPFCLSSNLVVFVLTKISTHVTSR